MLELGKKKCRYVTLSLFRSPSFPLSLLPLPSFPFLSPFSSLPFIYLPCPGVPSLRYRAKESVVEPGRQTVSGAFEVENYSRDSTCFEISDNEISNKETIRNYHVFNSETLLTLICTSSRAYAGSGLLQIRYFLSCIHKGTWSLIKAYAN